MVDERSIFVDVVNAHALNIPNEKSGVRRLCQAMIIETKADVLALVPFVDYNDDDVMTSGMLIVTSDESSVDLLKSYCSRILKNTGYVLSSWSWDVLDICGRATLNPITTCIHHRDVEPFSVTQRNGFIEIVMR